MSRYQIAYDRCGRVCVFVCGAESEGEAVKLFYEFTDSCDDCCEFISIVEVK
jgi:hypothetical protein